MLILHFSTDLYFLWQARLLPVGAHLNTARSDGRRTACGRSRRSDRPVRHRRSACTDWDTFLSCFEVDCFCRSIRRTLAGNPFRRCAVFFSPWHAHFIACFPGESIPWTVIQFYGFWISPPLTLQRTFFLHLLTILIVKFP